jgi:dTDP-4-amino-4,6-dideoxygalactose transaminase
MKIPMSSPDINDEDICAVTDVLHSRYLSRGSRVQALEEEIAAYLGARHAVAVNSGTSALHLAVIAAGIGEGDWVITTPFSFISSANCLLFEGAVPVFVDIDPRTNNIDPRQAARAAEDLTAGGKSAAGWLPPEMRGSALADPALKAVLAVDIFGQPADYHGLREVTDQRQLALIEDSCEALGSAYQGKKAGTLGDVGVFGFYPNKQLTAGEGGMLVTDREDWAALYRSLRNQGRGEDQRWMNHVRLGYNYRLDEMSAALARSQLARIDRLIARRARAAGWYSEALSGVEELQPIQVSPGTTQMSWFVYVVRTPTREIRDRLQVELRARGIPSRRYFQPIHLQPFYRQRFGYRRGMFPKTEEAGDCCLALPFSSVINKEQVELVVKAAKSILSS